ncbi:PhzF family phenazine biosynthesis protein [Phenylobacterium sp.]|uniref:PhzF family phenazine biosynthesis protein n=1 Tax=Phenylobacterium sp. TaxID=1871053 RepID=UPI00272F892B|nr:PhzF family phenazine biosynthesis protein [Phenylobacterium sp.]MDP1872762.1 PhzF family phenazine biosynthesis protein [Phenylobacterium sp.]MDP3489955.1 PhzF family phenazine biosynthesis protein [Phenylobacterium sp.]
MRQWTIDAFASSPFRGNPACVVEPFDAWPADEWMQALAAENNQAETAFLRRTDDDSRFGLRWFTPAMEVPLCGHATLASAHMLFAELGLATPAVTFDTQSGPLNVTREGAAYAMDFPAAPVHRVETPPGLAEALGVEPQAVWAGPFLVAILKDEAAVRATNPDLAALKAVSSAATQGRGNVGVSALADNDADYRVVSRFFAPGSGISEDPTTGSLHCMLSPIFAGMLGRPRLDFHQAYPGRGGDLDCELVGDRVILRGHAVSVIESRLRL